MVQKTHSTYDSSRTANFVPTLRLIKKYYARVSEADIMLWHEGDVRPKDVPVRELAQEPNAMNIRFCNIKSAPGAWGKPRHLKKVPTMRWVPGYRYMIRWYAITIWPTLKQMGYDFVLRFDDDSYVYSPIRYNMFDVMRKREAVYGWRQTAEECGFNARWNTFVDRYVRKNQIRPKFLPSGTAFTSYCSQLGQHGYYNNFFVADINWFLSPPVKPFVDAFDRSNQIFTDRDNDLIFQTAVVKLFAEPRRVVHFVDWTYAHYTVEGGVIVYGGIEIGTHDPDPDESFRQYRAQNRVPSKRPCSRQCRVLDVPCELGADGKGRAVTGPNTCSANISVIATDRVLF